MMRNYKIDIESLTFLDRPNLNMLITLTTNMSKKPITYITAYKLH